MKTISKAALVLLLATSTSCATIVGTAVSPVTGGVDLVSRNVEVSDWYYMPPVFLGGAIAGPFVAIYNGLAMDFDATMSDNSSYPPNFSDIFRPFELMSASKKAPAAAE